jgi:dTDP-4-amino-4,6-dideoxygalactose transaminase
MHTFGQPCDIRGVLSVADEFGLPVVEDSAEALGSLAYGQHAGTYGKLGILSFNGNKIMTTGGGGAIMTNDSDLARQAKHLTTTARRNHGWEYAHDAVGYNYRMPNINAALGCAQLERLDSFIVSKRRLHTVYEEVLNQIEGIRFFSEAPGTRSNYWLQTIILDKDQEVLRDQILETLNGNGFSCRPAWSLLPSLEPFLFCPSAPLPIAKSLVRRIINIPSSAGLV